MKLSSYTCLAFLVNRVINANPATDLSYDEIWDATDEGRLLNLLVTRYGHLAEFTFVTQSGINLEQMEAALCDAAAAYQGRVTQHAPDHSPNQNSKFKIQKCCGLCLVMDIILEAIQRQFCHGPYSGALPQQPDQLPVTD